MSDGGSGPEGSPTGELVTLLFTDIEGSTRLLDRLGDRYAELLAGHHRVLREAIEAAGGREVDTAGDSFFVTFANPDDAVECARRAQRGLASCSWPDGEVVRVRIGIHTGAPVVRGDSYVGMDVHRAARVMGVAHGGQVLVTDATRAALGRSAELLDLGQHRLKGIPGPVHLFQLSGAELAADFPPLHTLENWDLATRPFEFLRRETMEFVGRAAELERLNRLWEQAQDATLLALVGGDAGVGKTRLAYEFCRAVYGEGAVVLVGRCSEETLTPYQPVVEALGGYVARCPPEELTIQVGGAASELVRLVPELVDRLPGRSALAAGEAKGDRYRLFEAVARLLERAAKARPLVLLLEDVHWADASTLLLIRHIARAGRQGGMLLLGTYRERELENSSPLAQAIADLHRDELVEKVTLKGLTEADIGELLTSWAGHEVPRAFVAEISSETEGNPLFVMRHLAETGALSREDGRWSLDRALVEVGIPESVKAVISSRLAHLDESPRRILALASVMGREFSLDAIELAGELSDLDAVDLMDDALAAGLIDEDASSPGLYRFSHALIQETLYQSLSITRRARMHRRIGEALETLTATSDPGSHLVDLAHHFFFARSAGTADKAVDYSQRAGDWSQRSYAWEESITQYRNAFEALTLAAPNDHKRRLGLLLALGRAQSKAGQFKAASETFWRAANLAEQLGAAEAFGQAALGVAGPFVSIGLVDERLIELLGRALAAVPQSDTLLRSLLMAALAQSLAFGPGTAERQALATQALDLARDCGSKVALAWVIHHVIWATWSPDNLEDRLQMSTEMVELMSAGADELASHDTFVLYERGWRLCCLLEKGNRDAVAEEFAKRAELADKLHQPFTLWQLATFRALEALLEGRFDEVEDLAQEAFAVAPESDNAIALYGAGLLMHRRETGRLEELTEALEGFVEQYPLVPAWRAGLADLYAEVGRLDDASRELNHLAQNEFGSVPRDMMWKTAMFFCSEVCGFLNAREHAESLYELFSPYEDQCVVVAPTFGWLGSVAYPLGILAGALGKHDKASSHFEKALAVNGTLRASPLVARTQYCYARMLSASPHPADRQKAVALAGSAQGTAEELGMRSLAIWTSQLQQTLEVMETNDAALEVSEAVVVRTPRDDPRT